jgi:ribosomal protein S25
MGKVVKKKDIKEILKDIGDGENKGKNPYLIYKNDTGKIIFKIKSQPEITKNGEKDILGNIWKQKWAKVEMKVVLKTKGLEHKKVLEMGGATEGKPTSALFKAMAINFDRNNLDFDDIIGTVWKLDKNSETGWYEIEYLEDEDVDEPEEDDDEDEEEEKPKKKPSKKKKKSKKKKSSGTKDEVIEIIESLSEEPEFEEAVAKDKFITAIALRGSVSMDDVEKLLDELEEDEIIEIDEDEDVIIL